MFYKIIILVTTLCATKIGGDSDLLVRSDYTYNKEAGGWLKFHQIPSTWNDAKIRCHGEGAILASPLDITQKKAMLSFVADESIKVIFGRVHASPSEKHFAAIKGAILASPLNIAQKNAILSIVANGDFASIKEAVLASPLDIQQKKAILIFVANGDFASIEGAILASPLDNQQKNAILMFVANGDFASIKGAILASPLNITQKNAILSIVANEPIPEIFTGVHASFSDGDFASIEGVPLSQLPMNWTVTVPYGDPRIHTPMNCLAMMPLLDIMVNVKCTDALPYVCYMKKTKRLMQTECGTSDQEYKQDKLTKNCYKFHRQGLTWSKAYMTCAAEGGYLAIINSEHEHNFLKDLYDSVEDEDILSRNPTACHIGFRDLRDGGSWFTIHGQTLAEAGFARWADGKPDNSMDESLDGEACGSIRRNGLLDDIWCGWVSPFICEKSPASLEAKSNE